jgi:hypothetical protein
MSIQNLAPASAADGLRRWARGAYAEEAAVELLARAFGGRFASVGCRWVQACDRPGWFWLDGEALIDDTGSLSSGERRLLAVVGSLASGAPLADLAGLLAGMDRPNLQLVLAALAHAGGSHEHTDFTVQGDRAVFRRLGPLVDWPAAPVEVAS